MSQKPPASGPPTTIPPHRSQETLPPLRVATLQPSSYHVSPDDAVEKRNMGPSANPGSSIIQSPRQRPQQRILPPATEQAPSTTRSLGVRSILNPSHPEVPDESNRQQSSIKFESPASTASSVPYYPLSAVPQSPSAANLAAFPPSPGDGAGRVLNRAPRRILTPKSPGRRAASLRGLPPPATINASEAPFAPARGRIYSPDPSGRGTGDIPPMPTPPAGRFPLPFPPVTGPAPPFHDRRASGGGSQTYHSQSASPTPSHSSYSQYTSPAVPYASHSGPSYSNPGGPTPYSGPWGSQAESASLGQGSSLQMTFDTESGPMHVPVTVDVQAASKMADEKRKRNAGASARFRQRRKEKEKEASHTIAKLEQDIRDLADDKDFYRLERNFFRDMLSRTQTPIPPRPRSPIHRRPHSQTELAPGPAVASWQQAEERAGLGRNTRRRTSSYQAGFESPVTPSNLAPPMPSSYRPPPLQPPFTEARSAPNTGPAPPALVPPPPPPRTQAYDPFRRDPYDRSWNPAP